MGALQAAGEHRLGVDIGGTFTDLVLVAADGGYATRKLSSTPDDYGRAILDGLRALLRERGLGGAALREVIHGATVATNAILEYRGAKTALLTTRGFRDVLELRRVRAPSLYNPFWRPPRPLVERRLRLEVDERISASGDVLRPLDEASVQAALARLGTEGVEAVAVCLLHSYRNPTHERRVGEIVRAVLPEAFLSLSIDVLPEVREYERTSTTVINAYIGPVVRTYLHSLRRQLAAEAVGAALLVMQSNGGVMSGEAAEERPAHIVESGPAAGVIAAQRLGDRLGLANLITLDMGGTTAKASLIEDGRITQTTEYEVGAGISLSSRLVKGGGHALKLPVLDIAEVGAGGGSILWIDKGGALRVGPRSAGAIPGPACYDAGGDAPTITDANLVLGYLNPRVLAGGAIQLVAQRAHDALGALARALGLSPLDAAHGAYTLANASMMRAVKAVSTYRGRDPRDFALLAFGGNGPMFAAEMARALDMRTVIVPPAAGLFSAFGLLEADLEQHLVQTFFSPAAEIDLASLNHGYEALEARARAAIAGERRADEALEVRRFADLRYSGQAFELTVPVASRPLRRGDLADLLARFGSEHERTYGHHAVDEPAELVNLRIVARLDRPRVRPGAHVARSGARSARPAYFGSRYGVRETPVLTRAHLTEAQPGPLIVEDYDATTLVPPRCTARRDERGNIVIAVGA